MLNDIFQVGDTSVAVDKVKVKDMVKLEETIQIVSPDPSLKLRKETDEKVLHVSGSNISLLKLSEVVKLAKPKTAHLS